MANGIRTGNPREFNKGRSSKFRVGSRVQQTSEEGWKIYWRKRCGNNNKKENNSLKTLNDKIEILITWFRFIAEIKIIFKNLKYVLLCVFQRIYLCHWREWYTEEWRLNMFVHNQYLVLTEKNKKNRTISYKQLTRQLTRNRGESKCCRTEWSKTSPNINQLNIILINCWSP